MFYTLLTEVGKAKISKALAFNTQVNWREMAVGDGGGAIVKPEETQTTLMNEHYRAQLNQLMIDPENSHYMIAELIIPTEVGGWLIEEVGIFDAEGSLVAIANFPSTYKPKLEEGSAREMVIRIIVEVANAGTVTLKIDPSVVLASQAWCVHQLSHALQKAENLADVENKAQALANLGGVNAGYVEKAMTTVIESPHFALVPIGVPLYYPAEKVPTHYLAMNGQKIDRMQYPELHALYGNTLPDLRGEFLRGWDGNRGVDKGRQLLSSQVDEFKGHQHLAPTSSGVPATANSKYEIPEAGKFAGYDYVFAAPTSTVGGNETRPRNVAFQLICRAR